ncbi:UPF0481 protein [Camellia lanceoleosa]|uniref:UPF0481 protein n=1 Tax=Camellia lanceoleosa TaxID=1840588 RepID=A0ACC0H7L0_9ERIC|nr:UPF0481 protein [Camellia lanceoleosa]
MVQCGGEDFVSMNIYEMLDDFSPSPTECCIFRLHEKLRQVNDEAYDPEIVSIGPYHRGKQNLQMMERHKLRYFRSLLQEKNQSPEKYFYAIGSLERDARQFYAEPISLNSDEWIKMMVLDGCFIIELLRKFDMEFLRDENDPIFKRDWIFNRLQRDLMLFENQIPFFILCELFDMIEAPNNHNRLIYLALRFFSDLLPGPGKMEDGKESHRKISHLLELIHSNWRPSFAGVEPVEDASNKKGKGNWRFIPNTRELQEAGVKIEKFEVTGGTLFDIGFKSGVMQIPPLTIEGRTESFFRNLIAYEQYSPDNQFSYVTDYVKFLDCLIDSPKDVKILSRRGIIDNWLGDDEAVSNLFNKISDTVSGTSIHFRYADIFNRVNIHCSQPWNLYRASLNRNYLNNPWGRISILAALVLLLLTLTQTLFTVFRRKL